MEVERRGTRERTGYTVVFDEDWEVGLGELEGVRRWERCFDADALKSFGESRGEGAGFEDGHVMA